MNNALHTIGLPFCKKCVFAIREGKTQTGCSLGMLEKLQARGAEIIEAYDEEQNEFYVIKNKICKYSRNPEWGLKHDKKEWEQIARKEMEISYHAIIIAGNTEEDISITLQSLLDQEIMPKYVSIIRFIDNPIRPTRIIQTMKTMCEDKFIWTLRNPATQDFYEALDDTIKNGIGEYYTVAHAGYTFKKVFKQLDDKINNDGFIFAAIAETNTDNGMIVPISVHKQLYGNGGFPILEKIRTEVNAKDFLFDIDSL